MLYPAANKLGCQLKIKLRWLKEGAKHLLQGLEGVLRDPGFSQNRVRDSGIPNKSRRDS